MAARGRPKAELDVLLGGGPTTVKEFLSAGLVDYLHVIQILIVLGRGVRLWDGLESLHERYAVESATMPNGPPISCSPKNI
jgi:riboflavin biosynthesis pyrimidine reductase